MAKCKDCARDALPGEKYCASCRAKHDHGNKRTGEIVGVIIAVVGVIIRACLGGKGDKK